MSIKQFNSWIKLQNIDPTITITHPDHASVMQAVINDVKNGTISFRPVEGTNIRKFIQNPYYVKADTARKLAMEALYTVYQHYHLDELAIERAVKSGLH